MPSPINSPDQHGERVFMHAEDLVTRATGMAWHGCAPRRQRAGSWLGHREDEGKREGSVARWALPTFLYIPLCSQNILGY